MTTAATASPMARPVRFVVAEPLALSSPVALLGEPPRPLSGAGVAAPVGATVEGNAVVATCDVVSGGCVVASAARDVVEASLAWAVVTSGAWDVGPGDWVVSSAAWVVVSAACAVVLGGCVVPAWVDPSAVVATACVGVQVLADVVAVVEAGAVVEVAGCGVAGGAVDGGELVVADVDGVVVVVGATVVDSSGGVGVGGGRMVVVGGDGVDVGSTVVEPVAGTSVEGWVVG
mmetsp:Transcript_21718/g.67450  ORF Transcript_21718/g.67450 Transcript_21718/m.67450 type:complete len:231 (-) Transcript_21718:1037-1729(-)